MLTIDIETTGLVPSTGSDSTPGDSITAIGIADDFGISVLSAPLPLFKQSRFEAETHILRSFSDYLSSAEQESFSPGEPSITFNGVAFDAPFIATRCIESQDSSLKELSKAVLALPQIDLARFASEVVGRRISKDEACMKLANIYVPKSVPGLYLARIYRHPELLTLADHLDMLQHNAIDLSATMKLYNRVKDFPDFISWRMRELKSLKE